MTASALSLWAGILVGGGLILAGQTIAGIIVLVLGSMISAGLAKQGK